MDRKLPYDEYESVVAGLPFIKRQQKSEDITVETVDEALKATERLKDSAGAQGYDTRSIESAEPGVPKSEPNDLCNAISTSELIQNYPSHLLQSLVNR